MFNARISPMYSAFKNSHIHTKFDFTDEKQREMLCYRSKKSYANSLKNITVKWNF